MNTPPEKEPENQESTVSIRSAHRWDTAFEGDVSDVKLDGRSLMQDLDLSDKVKSVSEQVAHAHGSVDRTFQSVEKVDSKMTEVDRLFREEHRKTRAIVRKLTISLYCMASALAVIASTVVYFSFNLTAEKKSTLLKAQIADLKSDTEVLRAQVYKLHLVRLASHPFEGEIVAPADDQIDATHKTGGGGGIRLISPLAPA